MISNLDLPQDTTIGESFMEIYRGDMIDLDQKYGTNGSASLDYAIKQTRIIAKNNMY